MKRKLLSLFLASVMMLGTVILSIPASAALNFNDTECLSRSRASPSPSSP